MIPDRLPPQDIDTEAVCLSSVVLNKEALNKVQGILHAEDFYLDKHRIIFETIIDLENKSIPVDITTIKQNLEDKNLFDKIGGESTLVDLYRRTSTSANVEFYAKRIKELSLRRRLIEVATESIEKCYDMSIETDMLVDGVEAAIFDITEKRETTDYRKIDDIIHETLDNIILWKENKKAVTGIPTGYFQLDETLTGFHESELIIIAARPGMGKTAFALNIMNHAALRDNRTVLFFSLEMPSVQLCTRMLCIEAMVDSQLVRTGHINSKHLNDILETTKVLENAKIYIDDSPSLNILDIRRKARRLHQKDNLGMIVVDYMQLISSRTKVDRHLQIAEISRMLKQLARELKIPVIALSQLSRAVETRSDQIPNLSDLRESGSIEQDADVVMFIYREEKTKKDSQRKGEADIIIGKQRSGPTGTIPLLFWEQFTKFGNPAKKHLDEEATIKYDS